jgi:hypothetical protein
MISDVTSIVGACGVIVSVLILAWQTRQLAFQTGANNAIAALSASYNGIERLHDAWRAILEDPALRPYFYERKPCGPEDPIRPKALMVAEMVADSVEYGLMTATLLPQTGKYGGWHSYISFACEQPVLREVIESHPEWWPTLAQQIRTLGTVPIRQMAREPVDDSRVAQ